MKSRLWFVVVILAICVSAFTLSASARDVVLPAGTLLQCTLNEPNFSSATAEVGDPVLCHLRALTEFGQQAFPRGTYLVGHLESAKDPGHFFGKGYLKLQFDRIGLPSGDLPLEAKVIATRGYKVDKEGKIDGKGHVKRDIIEWMLPPLWPWKVIMLPARGPRPALKGETALSLRLMDDVEIPQVAAQTISPGWHFFGHVRNESFDVQASIAHTQLAVSEVAPASDAISQMPQASYATYISRDATPPSLASMAGSNLSGSNMATLPGMPVFVLTSGTILSVSGYGYQDNRITYSLIGGGTGVISADQVDWNSTTQLNAQRGLRVTLHNSHASSGAAGF
ncbi:MAG: hypothetical protein WBQ08_05785 [Candidatus Sulfotelmatobacter sp.]